MFYEPRLSSMRAFAEEARHYSTTVGAALGAVGVGAVGAGHGEP